MPAKPKDLKQLNAFAAGVTNLLSTRQRRGERVRPELEAHCKGAVMVTLMQSDDGDTSVSYELDGEKTLKMVLQFCRTLEAGRLGEIGAQPSPLPHLASCFHSDAEYPFNPASCPSRPVPRRPNPPRTRTRSPRFYTAPDPPRPVRAPLLPALHTHIHTHTHTPHPP